MKLSLQSATFINAFHDSPLTYSAEQNQSQQADITLSCSALCYVSKKTAILTKLYTFPIEPHQHMEAIPVHQTRGVCSGGKGNFLGNVNSGSSSEQPLIARPNAYPKDLATGTATAFPT